MPVPRFEVPAGVIDGVNTVFTVSVPYRPGSTAVFLNGLLQERSLEDGWDETNPSLGEVTLKEAPLAVGYNPDVLQIFFIDTSPVLPETIVERLQGRISEVEELTGRLTSVGTIRGTVEAEEPLEGQVVGITALRGVIDTPEVLRARLRMVC